MNLADRETPRTDAAIVSAEYIRREMDYYKHKFILADYGRELEREHAALREALTSTLSEYVALVNCGDCGNWNPETEGHVIAARAILAATAPE